MPHKLTPHTKVKSNTSIKICVVEISSSKWAQMKALSRLENHFNSLSEQRKNRLEWREVGGVLFSSSGCPQSCAEALSLCSQTVPVPLLLLPRVRTCRDHKASLTHHLVINTSLTPYPSKNPTPSSALKRDCKSFIIIIITSILPAQWKTQSSSKKPAQDFLGRKA